MSQLIDNYQALVAQIKQTSSSKMPTLLAVSKTKPSDMILELAQYGHRDFGENYLQEAIDKIEVLKDMALTWHFIGGVQRNKTRQIAENFDWVHAVDRFIIAQRLSDQRPADKAPINLCVQVNIDEQQSKGGVSVERLGELLDQLKELPNLSLRGLMCIPNPEEKGSFERMQKVFIEHKTRLGLEQFDTLSMGMSADWPDALKYGSTMIRVGSSLFGSRDQ